MQTIFVHIPKTAGTALSQAMHARVGAQIHFEGYDKSEQVPNWHQRIMFAFGQSLYQSVQYNQNIIRMYHRIWHLLYVPKKYQYIFGHFYVQKYLLPGINNTWVRNPHMQYASFVREPLERAISKYYYTRANALQFPTSKEAQQFAMKFPTLHDFLLSKQYSNIQYRHLQALPINRYVIIGVVEQMQQSLAVLGTYMPEFAQLPIETVNQTLIKNSYEIASISPEIRAEFKHNNHADYQLYVAAVERLKLQYAEITAKEKEVV